MYDLTGKRFGRLSVVRYDGNRRWRCLCDCGNEVKVLTECLTAGDTRSCGCLRRELASKSMTTHGKSKTRLYRVWAGIKNRCYNPKTTNYKYYGGKGISMCEDWKNNFASFMEWAVKNGYDESAKSQECTLDRIDNSKGYSPDNCKWANHIEQCNNQSSNRIFTYNEKTMTMSEWAREVGMKYTTLRARIRKGWSFENAIETNIRKQIRISFTKKTLSHSCNRFADCQEVRQTP